jgi:membrane-bound inhibitor of C-type lysozyme
VNPAVQVQTYHCADGRAVQAGYPDARTAVLTLDGHAYTLKAATSASGVRYVGFGLQWWTKGLRQARLSRLKAGEDVASDAGVTCDAPSTAEPPPPGSPGGLPDDRTPLAEGPIPPGGAQDAGQVVQTYYALIESGRYAQAWALWADGARAGAATPQAFAQQFAAYDSYHAQIGAPGPLGAAAGSLYVEAPVVIYGEGLDGQPFHRSGHVTLRRVNDVPGSTARQRRWHIDQIALTP